MSWVDPLRGQALQPLDQVAIYPGSHYVNTEDRNKIAIETIRDELRLRLEQLKELIKPVE